MEVDEEADGQAHELEVRDELGFVDGEEAVHGFELEDHTALHEEVEAVTAVEGETFVAERDGELTLDVRAAEGELMREAVLVRGFEQPRPEVAVDLDASADDGFRNPIPPPFLPSSLFNLRAFISGLLPPFLPSSLFIPSDIIG